VAKVLFSSTQLKLTPVLGSPTPVSGMKVNQGESVNCFFGKVNLSTTISNKRCRRELSIHVVLCVYL